MTKFRLALIFAAGVAAQMAPSSLPASAADLGGGGYKDTPYVMVPWQGLYFGVHGGGAWGSAKVHDQFIYNADPIFDGNGDSTGAIGGAQAGYNVQRGHFVFGVEADIGYLGLSARGSDAGFGGGYAISGQYETSGGMYGDLTGRLGYAADRVLLYAKGGAAFLDADVKADYKGDNYWHDGRSVFHLGHSDTLTGWTIGAGAEYAISPSWSIKAEYQHFDFGSMSYATKESCVGISHNNKSCIIDGKTDTSITADAVKLGINYRLSN